MTRAIVWGLACALVVTGAAGFARGEELSLAGAWRFALDREDRGVVEKWAAEELPDRIELPGMLSAQGYGDVPNFRTKWTGDGWRYPKLFVEYQADENFKFPFFLQPPRHYVGAAWYQREVEVPAGWRGKRVVLHVERPHWRTTAFIDGREVGTRDSLGTPHEHELGQLAPGKHTLTLRIDNRLEPVNVGPLSHSVTDHTQGNWNGAVGRIALVATDGAYLDDVRVYPDVANQRVRVEVTAKGTEAGRVTVRGRYAGPFKDLRLIEPVTAELADGRATITVGLGPDARMWDEFAPHRYRLEVALDSAQGKDARAVTFGLREVAAKEGRIVINGRKAFLRGTLECCIFPLTGHPPTDVESWRRIVRICKEHGLNHIRFHSWCPPEAAFVAADELGFYYHVEVSSWANQGAQIGSGGPLDAWIEAETARMIRAYGNHPSFLMLAYGNEPAGPNHKKWLAEYVARWKAADARRLYTTGAGWPVMAGSDFHSSPDPRIQAWGGGLKSILNGQPPSTDFDWSAFVKAHPDAPVVSHEIGQWCVYPNFDEIAKYTGYFKARNFEIFREQARRSGTLGEARQMLMASGRLQVLAYKHDIEAALRTPRFGGFQLLDLHDFPGQGTALVGVLDAFWDSKGYVTGEEFRRFCGPVVPLARMKRMILTTAEALEATIQVAQFGPQDLTGVEAAWRVTSAAGGAAVAEGKLPARDLPTGDLHDLGAIRVPLAGVAAPAKLTLSVTVGEAVNAWDVFVYPAAIDAAAPAGVAVATSVEEALRRLAKGERVLLLAEPSLVRPDPVHGRVQLGFSPIFWNTAWTNWQPPHTLGVLVDPKHPAFARFPTEAHANWQWWDVVTGGTPFIVTARADLRPIVQVIDDWVTGRKLALAFEARVGEGRLLACSAPLRAEGRPAARQLLRSLLAYAGSDAFNPATALTAEQLRGLMREPTAMEKLGARVVRADSEQPGYEAAHLLDGDAGTMWHTTWGEGARPFPHEVVIELAAGPAKLAGLRLTPRQDGNPNGGFARVTVYASEDGRTWGEPVLKAELDRSARVKTLRFGRPVTARFLRLVAEGSFKGEPYASLAEVEAVVAE